MSEATDSSLESSLRRLKCHFTWNLLEGENSLDNFEDKVCHQTELQSGEFKATTYNLLAFIEHQRGRGEEALRCLRRAEDLIQQQHPGQVELRSLVTWGNYAWVYHGMGRLSDAQAYVDKVREACKKFSSPYRMESPELDCEEGWSRLKCGTQHAGRAKACFEKCLDKRPQHPESTSGLAICSYRLDEWSAPNNPVEALRRAIELNPDNQYIKVLLALKLQKMNKEEEAERLVEEAVGKAPCAIDVLRGAAMLYRKKNDLDSAIELLTRAVECSPKNAYLHCHLGVCYRAKVLECEKRGLTGRYGDREDFQELIRHALDHLKRADELNGTLANVGSFLACLHLQAGQYEEAEHYFQREFGKELTPEERQVLHLRYGNFQWFQRKCESKAIHHFMEGVKINQDWRATGKMENKLRGIARARLSRNRDDPQALRILACLQELDGKRQPAGENSERGVNGRLSPSASSADE